MLHDVVFETHTAREGVRRHTVQVDADGGDDAVAKAKIEAAQVAPEFRIIGVNPSSAEPVNAPLAALEGEDDPMVPDEMEAPKRGRGRPRATAMLDGLSGEDA